MPYIYAAEEGPRRPRRIVQLVFPQLTDPKAAEQDRWVWPELRAGISKIQGFGLFPANGGAISWNKLERPLALPYLGKETEVESASQARVLRGVLGGCFDLCRCDELRTPEGHCWVQDGIYVTLRSTREAERDGDTVVRADERLIQVAVTPDYDVRGVLHLYEGDEEVCYMRAAEAAELLHLPQHIFAILTAHAEDEHADRNFSTHVVQFTRRAREHLLVNAHPMFRNSAFIMGNANEPFRGPPTLELEERTLPPLEDDDPLMVRAGLVQPAGARAAFELFRFEFPEVAEKSAYFLTKRDAYPLGEELSVVYGSSYNRTYTTWGHPGRPLAYKVPAETYADGTWKTADGTRNEDRTAPWAKWPVRVPGWWNVEAQPLNRPAFKRSADGTITLLPDLPGIVKARKQGLDGGWHEQRLAKLDALFLSWVLPELQQAAFHPTLGFRLATALPASERRDFALHVSVLDQGQAGGGSGGAHSRLIPPLPTSATLQLAGLCATDRLPPPAATEDTLGAGGCPSRQPLQTGCADPCPLASPVAHPPSLAASVPGDHPPSLAASVPGDHPPSLLASLSALLEPAGEFALPAELTTLSMADLRAEAAVEEATTGVGKAQPIFDTEVDEPDWDAPWRYPIGAIVWAKVDPFPFWPAVIEMPAVLDRDIARLREHGSVFVKFLGWNEARAHSWVAADMVVRWEAGVAARHAAKVIAKLSHRKLFSRGLLLAEEWLRTRPRPPPGAPPWWLVHATLGLQVGEEEPSAAAPAARRGWAARIASLLGRLHGGDAHEAAEPRAEAGSSAREAAAPPEEAVTSPGGGVGSPGAPRELTQQEVAGRWSGFLEAQIAYVGAPRAVPSGSARAAGEGAATPAKRGPSAKAAAAARRPTDTDPRPTKRRKLPPDPPHALRQSTLRFSSRKLEQQQQC